MLKRYLGSDAERNVMFFSSRIHISSLENFHDINESQLYGF